MRTRTFPLRLTRRDDPDRYLRAALKAARRAGRVIRAGFQQGRASVEAKAPGD